MKLFLLPLLLLFTSFPLPCRSGSGGPCRDQCGSVEVHYPFGIDDGCGAPQFRHMFTCNTTSNSLFFVTPNGNFKVQTIDYKAQTMTVYDPDMSTCNILQPHHDLVLSDLQYAVIPPSPDTVFALLNCSVDSPLLHRFRSLCFDLPGHSCHDLYSSCSSFRVFTGAAPNPGVPLGGVGGGNGSVPGIGVNTGIYPPPIAPKKLSVVTDDDGGGGGGYYGGGGGGPGYSGSPSGGYYGGQPGYSGSSPGGGGGYYGSSPGGGGGGYSSSPGGGGGGGYYGSSPGGGGGGYYGSPGGGGQPGYGGGGQPYYGGPGGGQPYYGGPGGGQPGYSGSPGGGGGGQPGYSGGSSGGGGGPSGSSPGGGGGPSGDYNTPEAPNNPPPSSTPPPVSDDGASSGGQSGNYRSAPDGPHFDDNAPTDSSTGGGGGAGPPCCFTGYSTVKVMKLDILDCTHYTSFYNTEKLRGVGPMEWSYGVKFSYSVPDMGCERCKKSGGSCGFDAETEALMCLCSGANNSTRQCGTADLDAGERWTSLTIFQSCILALAVFFLVDSCISLSFFV